MKRRTADGRERDPGGPPRSRGALRDGATVVGPRGAVRTSSRSTREDSTLPTLRQVHTLKVC